MAMWTSLDIVKSEQYIDIKDDDRDDILTQLIEDVTARMISYLDNDPAAIVTDELAQACAKQVTYEFRRRKDLGLSSVTYPDGNINKYQVDEWLSDVLKILDRNRTINI
jgi:hypothetical protein